MNLSRIVVATENLGKLLELKEIGSSFGFEIIGLSDLNHRNNQGEDIGEPPRVIETGESYKENASLKANAIWRWSGLPSLGDDTGLEVKALSGAPGIRSHRYAGEDATSAENIEKLLRELDGVSDRSAQFRSVLVLQFSATLYLTSEGVLEGEIAERPFGVGGFGYDSVFIVKGEKRTLAALKEERWSGKTHRGLASEKLFSQLVTVHGMENI